MRSIVITPAFNEAENIPVLLDKILSLSLENLDICVVNDHSTDGTADAVRKAVSSCGRVKLLENPSLERGLAHCYKAGFSHALKNGYDRLVSMDADLSHDPSDIPRLIDACVAADWVIGSRYCHGGSAPGLGKIRFLISKAANSYIRKKLGISIFDMTGGFNCFTRDVLAAVDYLSIPSKGFIFQAELKVLALKAGFRPKEVPISFRRRRAGRSKFSLKICLESLVRIGQLSKG